MILAFVLSAAAAAPLTVQTEGRLLNADDSPATGQHTFVVTLYKSAAGGSANIAWTDTFAGVPIDKSGVYSIRLGDQTTSPPQKALTPGDVGPDARWLGVKVDSDGELTPLLPLSQVPLAGLATSASTLFDAATSATLAASSTATAGALFPLGTGAKFPSTVLNGGHGGDLDASTFDGGKDWAAVTAAIGLATTGLHDATLLTGPVPTASLPASAHDATLLAGLVPAASLPTNLHDATALTGKVPAASLPSPLNADTLGTHAASDFLLASTYKPPSAGVERLVLNFDSAPGSNNSLVDSSGAGNNAAFTNAIYSANTGHNGSGAMSFSAGGGVVTVPDSPSLAVTNNVTLEAWVNLTTPLSALTGIVGKSGAYALAVDQNGSVSMSIVPGLSGSFVGSSPKIPLNAWTHVAASYDGLEVKIFVNGVMTSLTPYAAGPIAASTAPVYIGGGSTTAGLTGLVDEVKISAIAKTFADRVPAYAMYGSSGVATPVGDTVIPITGAYNEQGISHSGNAIHFSQPGAYLVTAGARVQSTGDVWQAFAIAKAGTIVAMSNGWGSVNSGDAGQQSATWLMTVDSTTADYTVLYRVRDAPGGGGIAECGFAGQSNCGARITFVRLGP